MTSLAIATQPTAATSVRDIVCTTVPYDAARVWQNIQLWRTQVAEHSRTTGDQLLS